MTIAVCYPDKYPVQETFELLKVPWVWYEKGSHHDVVIARKADVPGYGGPLIDLTDNDIFRRISELLNTGRSHLHEPECDILIDQLRQDLRTHTLLIEIPARPWDHPYMVSLTHDVDLLSIRERRWLSAGYAAVQCICKGMVAEAFRIFLAKCGATSDPYDLFPRWMAMEKELGVRSTFFFLPFPDRPGACSPPIRTGYYSPESAPIPALIRDGWEAGVHGIDNWTSERSGRDEIAIFKRYGSGNIGNRVHWLVYDEKSLALLDKAGYFYDSTVGYNDDIGFRAGTLQVYRPKGADNLVELPLHIQDIALFGRSCWELSGNQWIKIPCLNLDPVQAAERIAVLMEYAKKYGGAVTILWHYESIAPPANLESLYCRLVEQALAENAWLAPAGLVVQWFLARRALRISCTRDGKSLIVSVEGDMKFTNVPAYRLRVFISPDQIQSVDARFIPGTDYIDIPMTHTPIRVLMK